MKKLLLFLVILFLFSTQGNTVPVSNYVFSQSVQTYTKFTDGTVLKDGLTAMDSWVSSELTIPTFTFADVPYTTAWVTSNGLITLGGTAPSSSGYSGISVGYGSGICICPFNADLDRATTTAATEIRWGTSGSEIIFQWTQVKRYGSSMAESFDLQVRLNTSTGAVVFVYALNSGPYASSSYQPQVGIRTSTTDYNNREVTIANNWNTSVAGTANNLTCRFNGTSPATNFTTGLTYTFSQPLPCVAPTSQPTALTLTPGVYTINGSFTAASGSDSYLVVRSLNSTLSADPVNGTTYTVGTALGGGVVDYMGNMTNWTSSGLTATTQYYFFVFSVNSVCTGGPLYLTTTPLSDDATTNPLMTYSWNATTGSASWATASNWTPARNTPDPTDILLFNQGGSSTATDIPTQTVGRISVTGSTTINLQCSTAATLSIASDGTAADELFIEDGSKMVNNSISAPLTLTYSGVSSTGTIAGTLELTTPTGSSTNGAITLTGGVTPVTTVTGVLANGQSGGSGIPTITGSTATLIFSATGKYQHNFTNYSGTMPLATWNTGSTCEILGFTTASTAPTNINQAYTNLIWNCPNQTASMAIAASLTIPGTFTLTSTGTTGTLRITGSTTSYTLTVGNYTQTGGTLDLSSSTGKGTLKVSGTFNQSGGTITETGTQAANTIEFNGETIQSVTLGGTLANTLTYQVNNDAGISLTGTMAITTGASLIISSDAAAPIVGGTLTYTGTTTLVYNSATGDQTVTLNEWPETNGPTNLTINAPNHVVTIPFDRTIATGTLTMTTGDIYMGNYTLTLGSSVTSMGTLTYTAGTIVGKFKRWVSAATGSKDYPVGILNNARKATINYTVAPTTGGTITAQFIQTDPGTAGLPLTQGTIAVNMAAKAGYWRIAPGDGLAGGTYTGTFTATNFPGVNSYANLVLIQRADGGPGWVLNGTHVTTTGTNLVPVLSRTGMIGLDEFGVGGDAAANPLSGTNMYTIASGEWGNGSIWNTGLVPTSTDFATISNGHTVTLSGTKANYFCGNLTVSTSGTLTNYGENLAIGTTITNNGVINNIAGNITVTGGDGTGITVAATSGNLNITGGTVTIGPAGGGKTRLANSGTLSVSGTAVLNVNGNLHCLAGSTFNQSAGEINIDGNAAGVAANSVASATYLLALYAPVNWTGGTLTIVDPHANTTSTYSVYYSTSVAHSDVSTAHTLRYGDGVSSDLGGSSTYGFYNHIYASTKKLHLGKVIVNGPGTGTAAEKNRKVTFYTSYSFGIRGDIEINNNGEFYPSSSAAPIIAGNIIVNTGGIFTAAATVSLALPFETSSAVNTTAQQITNNGTIRNNNTTPTALFTSLTVNNKSTSGVTLNSPLSVSGTLTLTRGIVNTTVTNGLLLGTATAAGTLSGTSDSAYINGPFARTFAASRTATGTYSTTTLFPVGKGTTYLPVYIDPSTSAGGAVVMSGEAFTSNSGTMGTGVNSLSTNRWEALAYSGGANLTGSFIRLGDAGIVTGNQILQAPAGDGEYSPIPVASTFLAGTPNTLTTGSILPIANYTGYFAYGSVTPCTVPTAQPTAFAANYVTPTGFTGSFNAAIPAPSNYLVVRYPSGGTPVNPVDYTSYTVGAALGTGTVRYIGTLTTFTETGLTASTTYDYYVYSYNNAGCYGPVYYTTAPLFGSVTTCGTAVDAPDTPTASAIGYDRFTASWGASTSLGVHYILDVATNSTFTNYVSGYEAKNVGANLSDVVLGLTATTTYYVRVRAMVDSSSCTSPVSGSLTATTACSPVTVIPFTESFDGTTFPPTCWAKLSGILDNPSYPVLTTAAYWVQDDWRNIATGDKAAKINIYSTSRVHWLVTPIINIDTGTYELSFDLCLTDYGNSNPITSDPNGTTGIDDKFAVVISTDGGLTWSSANTLRLWDNAGSPYEYNEISHLGEQVILSLSGYSGLIRIGFYGESTVSNADNDLMINNVSIAEPPFCRVPKNLISLNITKTTADLNWTIGENETQWDVKFGPPGFNVETEGTLITGISIHPYTLDPTPSLTPLTTYDWYVRANCGVFAGTSFWVGPKSFTTLCDYFPVTSTTQGTRCGTGTVDLAATSDGGTLKWYGSPSGGTVLGTGNNFTTPVISDSTFFYVGVNSPGTVESSVGMIPAALGTSGVGSTTYGLNFDALATFTLKTVDVYPYSTVDNTPGTLTIRLINTAGETLNEITVNVVGHIAANVMQYPQTVELNFNIVPATGLRLVMASRTGISGLMFQPSAQSPYPFPYVLANTVSINYGTYSGAAHPELYYYFYNWFVSVGCTSPLFKVLAGVTPAPDLAVSSNQTVCNNEVATLTVTTGNSDFDVFTWSPIDNLYTDLECLTPYTALTDLETVYYKSTTPGAVTYTCTGSNTITGCNNLASSTVNVLTTVPTVTASRASLCISGSSTMTLAPATGWGQSTFQWQESSDGVYWADILDATSQNYTAPSITSTTIFRVLIKNSTGVVCQSPQDTVVVDYVEITTTEDGERCGPGTVDLAATGIGVITWYDAASGGTPIGTGPAFTTPVISTTTTYYVAAESGTSSGSGSVGPTSNSIGTGSYVNLTYYEVFDVLASSMTLKGVYVYPNTAGDVKLVINNSAGTQLTAITYPVTTPSVKTYIPIEYTLSAGTGYRIGVNTSTHGGGVSLYRNDAGAVYPYTLPGIVSITGNTFSGYPAYYYYCYDWVVSTGCVSAREPVIATVTPSDDITPTALPSIICPGASSSLNVTSANTNYEYLWTPGNLEGASQSVSPVTTTEYTVTATDPLSGCTAIENITVNVNPAPSTVTVTPPTAFIGTLTQLTASGGTITSNPVIGTGTTTNSTTGYPAPYTNYYGGAKHQILILASELTAAGVLPNSLINSVSFNVAAVGTTFSGILNYFQISMKNTTTSALTNTSFESGLTLVYGPQDQAIPITGLPSWVTHTIAPFPWDGTSNLLIETSYSNGNNGTTTDYVQMYNSATTFYSSNWYRADQVSAATILAATTPTSYDDIRPNVTLGVGLPTLMTWSPASGLWMDNPPTIPYAGQSTNVVFADPAAPVTYTATATNTIHGCTTTGTCVFTTLTKTLNLTTLFLEGLYAGSGTMNQAMGDGFVPQYDPGIADHITVELRNSADYNDIITTKTDVELSTSGTATTTIDGTFGGQYYLTIKHRNSIETVSATYLDFAPGTINYAFDVKEKAYGSNMGEFIDAQAAIYAGDVNQDGLIDGSDLNDIGNLNDIFATGYLDEDVNGDGLVDGSDLNICGNNNDAFVAKITP